MKNKYLVCLIPLIVLLFVFALYRVGTETSDTQEYFVEAELFASGDTNIQTYSAHSALMPFLMGLFGGWYSNNLFLIVSVILILFITYLVYRVTKKEWAMFLFLLSPITIGVVGSNSPLIIASLLFFLSYICLDKWRKTNSFTMFVLSGIFLGLSCGFYFLMFIYSVFFFIAFFRNLKFKYVLVFLVAMCIGLIPKLLFDYYYFGFPFHSFFRLIATNMISRVMDATYNSGVSPLWLLFNDIPRFIDTFLLQFLVLLFGVVFPLIYGLKVRSKYRNELLFVLLSVLCVFIMGGFFYFAFAFLPILMVVFVKALPRIRRKQLIVLFVILVLLSGFLVCREVAKKPILREEMFKSDTDNIKEDFLVKEFVLGTDMLDVVGYFDDSYEFYWWDEYVAEKTDNLVYNSFRFKENPKIDALRIMYFEFGYMRNVRELPSEIVLITREDVDPGEDFDLIRCYNYLCVYEEL